MKAQTANGKKDKRISQGLLLLLVGLALVITMVFFNQAEAACTLAKCKCGGQGTFGGALACDTSWRTNEQPILTGETPGSACGRYCASIPMRSKSCYASCAN